MPIKLKGAQGNLTMMVIAQIIFDIKIKLSQSTFHFLPIIPLSSLLSWINGKMKTPLSSQEEAKKEKREIMRFNRKND